jgi:hypothetical protein
MMRFGQAGTFSLTVDGLPVTTMTRMFVVNGLELENGLPALSITVSEASNQVAPGDPNRKSFELTVSATVGPHTIPYESEESDGAASMTYDHDQGRWQAVNRTGNATITVSSMTTRSIAGSFDGSVEATTHGTTGSHRVTGEFAVNFDCNGNSCSFW